LQCLTGKNRPPDSDPFDNTAFEKIFRLVETIRRTRESPLRVRQTQPTVSNGCEIL